MTKISKTKLARIGVRGIVQGVGFRPFVYQLARRLTLTGWVTNTSSSVLIEIEGIEADIKGFLAALREGAPPRADVREITVTYHPQANYKKFEIRESLVEEGEYQLISPDIATCDDCLAEIFDPADRRYRYPFTNCTNCGPRFTIIEDIPYDRPLTTMRHFEMCPECKGEYDDPLDRRFHAQPNACPNCGPALKLLDASGNQIVTGDVINECSRLLQEGKIIAVKGLGGYLLGCDATSERAVTELRKRKQRPAKPLAVMVTNIEEARKHAYINKEEESLLAAPQSPIVLLEWREDSQIAKEVAPGIGYMGAMLPYTPLHHTLLRETGLPLVMTSGNLSEEPITKDNDEAVSRLSGIADYFLTHNREIYARYDDSVATVEDNEVRLMRRARGYAPYPVHLDYRSRQILAVGAGEKNTFCLTRENHAFLSQHVGELDNLETLSHFEDTIDLYKKLFRINPELIACDMHPDYLATRYARELSEKTGLPLVSVQHHHAHIVSCLADNGIHEPVIGVAFDGTGYGTDGNIWGGEFLVADYHGFKRVGQLEYLPLPGGELAIRKPYRTAIGYVLSLLGESALDNNLSCLQNIPGTELSVIRQQVAKKVNSPLTSSMGRLFDAVSALIGIRSEVDYEAQAAIELEMAAREAPAEDGTYPFSVTNEADLQIIGLKETLSAIINDLQRGTEKAKMAARFHNTVAQIITELCKAISGETGIGLVALSGGVFQNRLLFRKASRLLSSAGLTVLSHHRVPPNDGGISLGQVVIANFAE